MQWRTHGARATRPLRSRVADSRGREIVARRAGAGAALAAAGRGRVPESAIGRAMRNTHVARILLRAFLSVRRSGPATDAATVQWRARGVVPRRASPAISARTMDAKPRSPLRRTRPRPRARARFARPRSRSLPGRGSSGAGPRALHPHRRVEDGRYEMHP